MAKKKYMSKLLEETKQLMASRKHTTTISVISKATQLDVNWLYAFENGSIKDPSVTRTENLNNFLKKVNDEKN